MPLVEHKEDLCISQNLLELGQNTVVAEISECSMDDDHDSHGL